MQVALAMALVSLNVILEKFQRLAVALLITAHFN